MGPFPLFPAGRYWKRPGLYGFQMTASALKETVESATWLVDGQIIEWFEACAEFVEISGKVSFLNSQEVGYCCIDEDTFVMMAWIRGESETNLLAHIQSLFIQHVVDTPILEGMRVVHLSDRAGKRWFCLTDKPGPPVLS